MATRFYLGYNEAGSPGHQVPYDASVWEQVSLIHKQKLRRTRRGQVVTTQNYVRAIPGSMDILEYHGLSEPLDVDQNIAGTFVGVSRFQQSNTGMSARVQLVIRVIKPDGTVRGVLWGPDEGAASDVYSGYTSKIIPRGGPVALTPVAALAGDRISIELGTKVHHTGSNAYTTNLWLGDSTATDMTLSVGNSESLNPWFEFSQDLTFKSEATMARIAADVVTKMQGTGKLARISSDIITKMQGTGKLARLSADVVVPQGMPNQPQVRWGMELQKTILMEPFLPNGSAVYIPDSSEFVAWPAGTELGDTIAITYESGWNVVVPSGWSSHNFMTGGNGSAMLVSKVMTGDDIIAGGVTLTTTGGSFPGGANIIRLPGPAAAYRLHVGGGYSGSGFTTKLISAMEYQAGEIAIYIAHQRGTMTFTCDRGTLGGQMSGSNASCAWWWEVVGSTGTWAPTFGASGAGANQYTLGIAFQRP